MTSPHAWTRSANGALALWLATGHILMTEAVARAPVSLLAGYEYTGIIWAFGFDVVLLGIVLDAWTVAGALVIVVAVALVAYAQRRPAVAPAA